MSYSEPSPLAHIRTGILKCTVFIFYFYEKCCTIRGSSFAVGNICPMNVFFRSFEVIGAASFQIIRIMSAGVIAEFYLVTKMEDKNEQIRQIVIRSYSTWSSGSNRLLLS